IRLQTVHKRLLQLAETEQVVSVCLSFDNSTTPTYANGQWSDGGKELYVFDGFISSCTLEFDETVDSSVVIQRESAASLVNYEGGGEENAVGCLVSLNGDDDEIAVLDKSCLGALDKSYEAGVRDAGAVQMGIRFDPGVDAHKFFYDQYEARANTHFVIALSDG